DRCGITCRRPAAFATVIPRTADSLRPASCTDRCTCAGAAAARRRTDRSRVDGRCVGHTPRRAATTVIETHDVTGTVRRRWICCRWRTVRLFGGEYRRVAQRL